MFWRGGLPYSVIDGNLNGGHCQRNGDRLGYPDHWRKCPRSGSLRRRSGKHHRHRGAALSESLRAFFDYLRHRHKLHGPNGFSSQRRNQYTGPRFFDMDMGLFKTFKVTEGVQLGIGAQAYNVFNHPNFQNPDSTLGDSTFGQINAMQPMPTSPYGVFLGFDSSVRVVQVSGKIIF